MMGLPRRPHLAVRRGRRAATLPSREYATQEFQQSSSVSQNGKNLRRLGRVLGRPDKFHRAPRSYSKFRRAYWAAEAPRGVPLDPQRGASTASSDPPHALYTRLVPPIAPRGSVGPPATAFQVRTRSTEPHGADLCPAACSWRRGRRDVGERRKLNGASTHVGWVVRDRARAPGATREPDRCERRAITSPDTSAEGAP